MNQTPDHNKFPFTEKARGSRPVTTFLGLNKSVRIAISIVALAALWMLTGLFASPASTQTKSAVTEAKPITVRVRDMTEQPKISELVIKGRTAAYRNVPIRAETSGRVVDLGKPKGGAIAKGEPILSLSKDTRSARLAEAQALVNQRQIQYDASSKLGERAFTSKVRVSESKALLDAAKATLAAARTEITRAKIRAPFDGTLADRYMEIGDYVKIGDIVARVATLNPIKITGAVTERDIGAISLDTPATAKLLDGREINGQITYVSQIADPISRTFPVEITAVNADGSIQEGLTAILRLPLSQTQAHKITPAVLSLNDAGIIGVKTVDAANVVRFHPVKIIGDGPDGMWVTGLPKQARVITVGHEFVSEGQTVTAVPEQAIKP